MKRAFSSLIGRSMLVALVLGGAALAAPSVAVANPACGATVTHDVKLTSDMDCSASATNGINVGKAGITINLNGHTLTGPSGNHYGIDNENGYDRVTVENGTILNYSYGVFYQYTSGSKVLHVKAHGASSYGIAFWYSQNGLIDHSPASGSDTGIYLYENTHVNVTNSGASHNSSYGVYDYYSLSTLNNVTANANGSDGVYVDEPLWIGSSYYTIENSTANNNSGSGFYIDSNYPTALYQAILLNNTANDNTDYGFYATVKTKGKGNHATGNGTANCFHVPCS